MSKKLTVEQQLAKMRADWDTVHAMLTDSKAPRRDSQGRTVYEVWADMVLANPAEEFARVARDILPKEQLTTDDGTSSTTLSIQQLYLTAVQAAQLAPNPRLIEAKPLEQKDEPDGG